MQNRLVPFLLIFCVILAVGSSGAVGQSPAEFSIESDATVTIPTETVSNDFTDGELTVSKTAVIGPNETLSGTATVPDPADQTYFVQFRNADERIIDDTATDGAETTFEFAAAPESPGSYGLNIWDPDEQVVKSVLPVVIASHDVSDVTINGSAPATANVTPNETAPVDVSLTTLEATQIDAVKITVWNDATEQSATLTESSSGEFSGTLPALDKGEYQVQIRVRGGETVNGRPSLIGLSEAYPMTVADTAAAGDDDDTDGGSTDQSDGGTDSTDDSADDGDSSSDGTTSDGTDDETTNGTTSDGTDDETTNGTASNGTDDETNGTADTDEDDASVTNGTDTDSETGTNETDGSSDTTDSSTDSTGSDDATNDTDDAIEPNDGALSDETADSTPLYVIQPILLTIVFGGIYRRLRQR